VIGGTIVLSSFYSDFQLPPVGTAAYDNIIANIVSVLQLGGLLSAVLTFPAMKYWGRKISLIIAAAVYFFGAAFQVESTHRKPEGVVLMKNRHSQRATSL
jgi:MFS family permease